MNPAIIGLIIGVIASVVIFGGIIWYVNASDDGSYGL
jgi:hypothetical protein